MPCRKDRGTELFFCLTHVNKEAVMLLLLLFLKSYWFPVFWLVTSVSYYFVLKKMDLNWKTCVVPFLAEREFSKVLFETRRAFWRPFLISAVYAAGGLYLGPKVGLGFLFIVLAVIVYEVFLIRLYWRIGKAFGKNVLFRIGTILVPPLFMLILGLGKSVYTPLEIKPVIRSRPIRILINVVVSLISIGEILVLGYIVGMISITTTPPVVMVVKDMLEVQDTLAGISGSENVITREQMMQNSPVSVSSLKPSREKFFPDHSNDKSTVVLSYIVGSNLEDKYGFASINIDQMVEASKKGDSLKFVMQTGGAGRWFTIGVDWNGYGRYEISNGNVKQVEKLPDNLCMAEQNSLSDFLKWAKEAYPADRYILTLWDHGGGVAMGFGQDSLNKRNDGESIMQTSEVIAALKDADMKFDIIGFDACLMQDFEIAAAMEPYADYYLASEETEGGFGWYYTSPFGMLAENPGISSEDLGRELVSTFDEMNQVVRKELYKKEDPDTKSTLSLIDTALAKPAYDTFTEFLQKSDEKMIKDPEVFNNLASAGQNTYSFAGNYQIDLIDYLQILKEADYKDVVATDEEIDRIIGEIQACILLRNSSSASGINGVAFAFPYKDMMYYSYTRKNLEGMELNKQTAFFDDIFSIMAAQKKKMEGNEEYQQEQMIIGIQNAESVDQLIYSLIPPMDYTQESWYKPGFEDYDTTEPQMNIHLIETDKGYKLDLSDNLWKIIADCRTIVYQKLEDGELKYLGTDYIGELDENKHPMVGIDRTWIHIDGKPVCYEADQARTTENGIVYTGKVRARLNDDEDITLYIEWAPVKEGEKAPRQGQIIGYDTNSSALMGALFNTKGTLSLKAGDSIQFIFDFYDEAGNLIERRPDGAKAYVVSESENLKVEDKELKNTTLVFGGLLKDVYQRTMTTEHKEFQID